MYRKGYDFERELRLKLEAEGWKVIRSGGSKRPDLIAGRAGKVLVIECKVASEPCLYLEKDEADNLAELARAFGGEAVFAVKRKRKGVVLASVDSLRLVGKHYAIRLD